MYCNKMRSFRGNKDIPRSLQVQGREINRSGRTNNSQPCGICQWSVYPKSLDSGKEDCPLDVTLSSRELQMQLCASWLPTVSTATLWERKLTQQLRQWDHIHTEPAFITSSVWPTLLFARPQVLWKMSCHRPGGIYGIKPCYHP